MVKASEGKTGCIHLRILLYYNALNAKSEEVKANTQYLQKIINSL